QGTKARTKKKWVKVVAIVAGVSAVGGGGVAGGGVVRDRGVAGLGKGEGGIDKEIRRRQGQMGGETEPEKLVALGEKRDTVSGEALKTIETVGKTDKKKAEEVADAGDEIDRAIREILKKFDAETYAVPPVFKERLQYHIDVLEHSSNLKYIYK